MRFLVSFASPNLRSCTICFFARLDASLSTAAAVLIGGRLRWRGNAAATTEGAAATEGVDVRDRVAIGNGLELPLLLDGVGGIGRDFEAEEEEEVEGEEGEGDDVDVDIDDVDDVDIDVV